MADEPLARIDPVHSLGLDPDIAAAALWLVQLAYSAVYMELADQVGRPPSEALRLAEREARAICDQINVTPELRQEVLRCFQKVRERDPRWEVQPPC